MTTFLPSFLVDKLSLQYSSDEYTRIIKGYSSSRKTSFRRNSLTIGQQEFEQILADNEIPFEVLPWFDCGYTSEKDVTQNVQKTALYENGDIYLQNPSSMLPPIMLSPSSGQEILDMCAAPGSKTTELYNLSMGKANITACEKDKIRGERLRFNLKRQNASRVNVLIQDARKLDEHLRYDSILLDAPCSGTGTILADLPKSVSSLSELLIKNSSKLQYSLLKKAASLLPKGGELIYSTCSLLSEENEDVVYPLIKKGMFEVVPHPELEPYLPLLSSPITGSILVCPTEIYEGFFAVHLRKT